HCAVGVRVGLQEPHCTANPTPATGRHTEAVGKALIAVGTFLSLCFVIFGGVVYFTRHEDTIAVDSKLSERLSRAVAEAAQTHEDLDLRTLTGFDFDRVLIFPPGTPKADVSRQLGFDFRGEL